MLLLYKLCLPGTGSTSKAALLQDALWCRMVHPVSQDIED